VVVCPTCREVNEEGRAICQKCGSSLTPDAVAWIRYKYQIRKPGSDPRMAARQIHQLARDRQRRKRGLGADHNDLRRTFLQDN